MISIDISKNNIHIEGHADYCTGMDPVCAMVSILVISFVSANDVKSTIQHGYTDIDISGPVDGLNMFISGLRSLASDFPDNIKLSEHL